ncbi:MAG TPA: CoA transferase [Thermoflexales bacterium]|nr:CoA transferase [Thermoflexales bacterium]HQZ22335.1 CoA transferase [Thermoflexales bacterium]
MPALSDIHILDFTRVLAGPYCTQLLADFGAEVIKIEQPGAGDITRQWGPPWVGDEAAYYLGVNRNKRSLTLNLKTEEGKAIARALAAKADVVMENFLPDTMDKLGLGYADLSAINPSLVYCALTGYGQTGPYRDRPGFDFMIQAQGGIMSITGPADGEPYKVGVAIADITTGLFAANAILAALHYRQKTGQGQFVDVALLDSQVAWLANVAQNYFAGETPARYGNAHASLVPYQVFATQDSHIAIAVGSDGQYKSLCECAGCMELWHDARFKTNPGRVVNRAELVAKLERVFAQKNTADWMPILLKADVPASPINDVPTILNDPHILARGMVQEMAHPTLGAVKVLGPVAKLSETPATLRIPPPTLGQDTAAILSELGYTAQDIAELQKKKSI